MQTIQLITDLFAKPPIAFDPAKSTLKAWAMYCLRDRGFKVVYAEKGDFAIEKRGGEKIYCRVTDAAANVDDSVIWIVHDPSSNTTRVIAPEP
ncbi:hypothetical protein J5X98_22385 [Leptothermofonsia sichuanensis E412]|uniref:hypothetical protein n=1 Tax=Leptothermofonsia sichuanensis TaxID=2917832 RepID=UPI001CA6FF97|nr:hypothetical protein [Leptothermofonsia sichuanensis]QZZ20013.1 hypothetical protein J5X98_22385 [Leptothermofonsia sichuanensis E412]